MEWTELLLIDKPKGITSFDVIRRLRKRYSEEHDGEKAPKMGHAGTLDPLATGLMLVGVGPGTKKLTEYVKLDKEYVAEVLIGERRSTGDMEGEVLEEKVVDESVEILRSKISTMLADMVGSLELPVSAYSAIKKDGVPMYKRARAAKEVGEIVEDVPMREMRIYETELHDINLYITHDTQRCVAVARFKVGSGTYIRSLAEELGNRIGYPATLQNLRRTKVGKFDIKNALQLEGL